MAAPSPRMTEVDAVSKMLVTAGLMPVSALTSPNAAVATRILEDAWRGVLAEGWWFNKRRGYTLTPNAQDQVTIPDEVIDLDDKEYTDDVIIVDGKLYSKEDNTDKFTAATVELNVILSVDFATAPLVAQMYAISLATATFVRGRMGDAARARELTADISLARMELMRAETNNSDLNILNNPSLSMHKRGRRQGLHTR